MKIAAVTWRDLANPAAGGAEVLIDRLLVGLAGRGHEVVLVCGGPVSQRAYEVIAAGGTYSQYLRAPWVCMTRVRDADVIIDAANGLPYFSPLWRRRPSLCLVNHVHTDQWRTRFSAPVAATCSAVERHVVPAVYRKRRFVAISHSTADALVDIGVDRERIDVIECGIDVPAGPLPEKSAEPLFVSLNRLVPHKRIDLLLDSWAMAGAAIPGRLVVAGDGPELGALRRQASSIPQVDILGRVSDEEKLDLLRRAWAVVSTSHHEGWGLSILEAAAVGTPAVAVDAPGIRDAVVDGSTGVLVMARDEWELPDAFAKALIDFVHDGERRRSLGAAALRRAREFSWDRFVDRWEEVLSEVAASGSRPAP